MTLPYDTGFPTPNDSLGTTQAKFFNNTASVKSLININHYDFTNTLYGNHKWVTYGEASSTFPNLTGILANAIATYGKSDGARTQLMFQPAGAPDSTLAIQLTAGDVTDANFGIKPTGWVFLPGGLILQYGIVTTALTTGTVTFLYNMPTNTINVSTTPFFTSAPNSTATYAVKDDYDKTGFDWVLNTNSDKYKGFFWTAIGY